MIPAGEFPWRWTLCGWSMAFKNPQVCFFCATCVWHCVAQPMKLMLAQCQFDGVPAISFVHMVD